MSFPLRWLPFVTFRQFQTPALGSRLTRPLAWVVRQMRGTVLLLLVFAFECPPARSQSVLVSATPAGWPGDRLSTAPAVSGDGTCVAFVSLATDLVPGDTNDHADVFVRRLSAATTTRVSVAGDGSQGNGASDYCGPSVSADCRYVAFASHASNLVAGDTNGHADVFVHDLVSGETSRVSRMPDGSQPTRDCSCPSLSADGRFVAYDTALNPLSSGSRIYLHDRLSGETLLVVPPVAVDTRRPAVSASGNVVAFMSYTRGGVPGDVYDDRLWLFDRETGTTRELARTGSSGDVIDIAGTPAVSGDGRWVAFASSVVLAGADANHEADVFLLDTVTGITSLISATDDGHAVGGTWPSLSTDGRFLLFQSASPLLDPRPPSAAGLFLFDRLTGHIARFTSAVHEPAMDAAGARIAHVSTWEPVPQVSTTALDADGDTMLDAWEDLFGLSRWSAGDADLDADGDGVTNVEEFRRGTHPRGLFTRLLAEGATGFFTTTVSLANPNSRAASAMLTFQTAEGGAFGKAMAFWAATSASFDVGSVHGLAAAEFSTRIESDVPLAVERTMTWDARTYGGHAETAVAEPATTWYLGEGATHSGFDLFYLLQNPGELAAYAEVTYLLPAPQPPIVKRYALPPASRTTLWVNHEDDRLGATDVSAVVSSRNDVPILVERAMYLGRSGQSFAAGHAAMGVTTPATEWVLAEGATGSYFDLFVLLANPGEVDAEVSLRYLLPEGRTVDRVHVVAPRSRTTVWVDFEAPELADTAVSTLVSSTNGVPVVAERVMWWPGPAPADWYEAHVSSGSRASARRWAAPSTRPFAEGADSFLLLANSTDEAGSAVVSLRQQYAQALQRTYDLPPRSRTNVWVNLDFAIARTTPHMVLVESDVPIVVERAEYWNAEGVRWAGGTSTRLTPVVEHFGDESAFLRAVPDATRASFDQLAPGSYALPLALGAATIDMTSAASALVLPPGPEPGSGLVSPTSFLTASVTDNGNNIVVSFPPGTEAAGCWIIARYATVTAADADGGGLSVDEAFRSFVGFRSEAGIRSIRVSIPSLAEAVGTQGITVNIGDIVYATP